MIVDTVLPRIFTGILLAVLMLAQTTTPVSAGEMLVVRNLADPGQTELRLSEADLLALPQITVRTRTEFTDGVVEFVGPLARDAIASIDTSAATTVHLVAVNDYTIKIPLSDFANYNVILAMSANGERLSVRDKGPIWLMYPLDDHTQLQDPVYTIRLVWQLIRMELR